MQGNLNGERLKKARIYRGFSVSELAEKSGCSRQSIYMYEREKTKRVDLNAIEALARTLDFPERFFCESDMKAEIGSTYFRALLTTSSRYREAQTQKMEFLADYFCISTGISRISTSHNTRLLWTDTGRSSRNPTSRMAPWNSPDRKYRCAGRVKWNYCNEVSG